MNLLHPSAVAALLSSEFCLRLTQSLFHFFWQGLAIALLLWIADRTLRRAAARARYSLAVAALLLMVACLPATYVALGFFVNDTPAAIVGPVAAPAEAPSSAALNGSAREVVIEARMVDAEPKPIAGTATSVPHDSSNRQSLHVLTAQLAPYATLAYLLGVAIMLARLTIALASGQRLRSSATPLADPAILAMAARQAQRVGLNVVPAIAWCQRAAAPLVVGIVRPIILLPTSIASGLAPDQLEALLAHELAHLQRLDLVVNLVQRLAESLLFFHPAVWYVSHRISIERENCCDDCVLAAGWGRVEYADALVRMAEVCAAVRGLSGLEGAALLAASGEGSSQFKRRVLRLLESQDHLRAGLSRGWLLAALGSLLFAVVALPLASRWKGEAAAQPKEAEQIRRESALDDGLAKIYEPSRTLAAKRGWSIAWDVQHPTQHGDRERVARLRVFPDGRVAAWPGIGSPLVETRIPHQEVAELVSWLIDEQHAGLRKPAVSAVVEGKNVPLLMDPLPEALWDQEGSRVAVVREQKTYDLLKIAPDRPDRPPPKLPPATAGNLSEEATARLQRLMDVTFAGGKEALALRAAFANERLHERLPASPLKITPASLRHAGFDSDGTLALFFHFGAGEPGVGFPRGEMVVRVPKEGERFVDKAEYWTSENAGDRWGRSVAADANREKRFFRGKDALTRIDEVKPAWSETHEGVQFGVALVGDKSQFRAGERVPLEMFVRNVGKEGVEISLGAEFLANVPEVKNAGGEAVAIEQAHLLGTVALYREFLKSGEAFGFRHPGVGLGSNPHPGEKSWHPYWAEPKPGKYTLRHTHDIDVDPANGLILGKRVRFTSGEAAFEVVADAGDQAKEEKLRDEERLIQSEIAVAKQALEKSRLSLQSSQRLAGKGLLTPVQLEAAEVALEQAQIELTKAQAKRDALRAEDKAAAVKRIEALLDKKVSLSASTQPLIFVIDTLEKAHGVAVTIDLEEVRARGATIHAQVSIDVADKPLREVFKAVLVSAGLDFEVTENGICIPAKAKPPAEDAAKPAGPAQIHVKYDIARAEDDGKIFVQHIGGRDIIGTGDEPHLKTNPVKKGQTLELKDLDPGDYQVARHRLIRVGGLGMSRFLDRQRFQLAAGETKKIDFTRPKGQPLNGKVLGLKEAGLATAVVNICAENAKDDQSVSDLDVTLFDSRLCAADGTFKTETLAPGRYKIIVEGFVITPERLLISGVIRPSFLGILAVTIPAEGEAPKVEVKLQDAEKVRAAANAGVRLEIHYDIPGAEDRGRFVIEGPNGSIGPEKIGTLYVNYVNNGKSLSLENLPAGKYQVTRYRTLRMEEALGLTRFLDRKQFELAGGDVKKLDFTRPGGKRASGKIVGPEGKGINKVLVNVCAESADSRESLRKLETTIHDALLAKEDGSFTTEPLLPGEYTIVAEGYLPLTPEQRVRTGDIEPRYVDIAKFTVPETGDVPPVEVKLQDARQDDGGAARPEQAWGDLTVQFVYDGPKPEMRKLPVPRDIGVFGAEALDESLLVGDKGELASVAVYVTSAGVPVHPEAKRKAEHPAELKVTAAGTQARIVPLMVPQQLKLINGTTVGANFRWDGMANSPFNFLVASEQTREVTLNKAERMPLAVTDAIHPWLIAFLLPLDHPYAAVSGADGIARLADLPQGEWTFRFWHEKGGYLKSADGEREFKMKIGPGENRLKLRVSPEFFVTTESEAAEPNDPGQAGAAPPEPDAAVSKELKQAGISIGSDQRGRITEVYLGAPATDRILQRIAGLLALKTLHIETTRQLSPRGFEHLAAAPALRSLGVYDVPLSRESVASVARIKTLQELSLGECGLTDGDLAPLGVLTGLKSLALRGNAITDAGLDAVIELAGLETLDLGNSSSVGSQMQITDRGLARLAALKNLKRLNLSSTRLPLGFSDQGLAHLSSLPDLESLDVSGPQLGNQALVHIGRCTELRRLGLHFSGFTDDGMKEILHLTKLTSISISSNKLTEKGLLHLGDLSRLEFAELRTGGVTDRVMERLAQIKSLARLDLYANAQPGVAVSLPPFTGGGLAHFKGHPGLRTLWLTNVEIDAGMLASLKELTQLRELTLMMPGLSDNGVRELQAALPKTRVSAAWGGHSIPPLQRKEVLQRLGLPPLETRAK